MSQKRSDQSKSRILEAAEKEFSEMGLYGARVDRIATAASINKRMLYEYFGNKEGLYEATLKRVYERLSSMELEVLSSGECTKAIKDIIRVYFKFLDKNPSFVRMVMWENLNNAKYLDRSGAKGVKDPVINSIRSVIARGKEEGVFRPDADEEQVILSLLSFTFSYFSNIHTLSVLLGIDMNLAGNIEKRIEYITELMLGYLSLR